jgi:hypothetical protein
MNAYLSPILSSSQSQDETSNSWLHLGREPYLASPAIKEGIFEVKALHPEPVVAVDDALAAEVKSALRACAAWH